MAARTVTESNVDGLLRGCTGSLNRRRSFEDAVFVLRTGSPTHVLTWSSLRLPPPKRHAYAAIVLYGTANVKRSLEGTHTFATIGDRGM